MPFNSKCVKCPADDAKNAALRWTLYNGQVAVVAPLCIEHMAPLTEIVNIVGPKPLIDTGAIPPVRTMKVAPLVGWTKPDDD